MDFSKLKKEYLKGGTSYRKLAEKYGVPFGTLRKVAAKEKWAELRNKTRDKTDTKIVEAISDKEAERAEKLIAVSDKILDKIDLFVDGLAPEEVVAYAPLFKQLTGALKDIKDIKGIKSPLEIEEQKARIAKLKKEAEEEDKTNEIAIIIEGGEDSWAE